MGKTTRLARELIAGYQFRMDADRASKIPLLVRRMMPDATDAQLRDDFRRLHGDRVEYFEAARTRQRRTRRRR